MAFERTKTARSTPSRHEKSLGLLTMKFVHLLQEAKDGVLDLKVAADTLAVKQRRRIYDIINVLEGVELIEKKRNIIQWRGENTGDQTEELLEQIRVLKAEISELEAQEKELDSQRVWLEENIKCLQHDPITSTYKYVTYEDICGAFRGDTTLAVVAPAGTQLVVPLPKMGQSGQIKYEVNLCSHKAPIQVMLISRDSDNTLPVACLIPPADSICAMPTPPNTPASLQRFPLAMSAYSNSSTSPACSQDFLCSDHQMVPPERDDAPRLLSTLPAVHTECQPVAVLEQQQVATSGPEFQSALDVSSLLKINPAAEHMKDDREGAVDLIDELMSTDGVDYSFNLEDSEGVCDLFDMQILNY